VIGEDGYRIINTGDRAYVQNFDSARTVVTVLENGSAGLVREIVKAGDFAPGVRYDFLLDTRNKSQEIAGYWNGIFPGAQIDNLMVKSTALNEPVRYTYEIRVPALMQISGENAWIRPFIIQSDFYRDYALMKERAQPVVLVQKWETVTELRYIMPRGYSVVSLPSGERYSHPSFEAEFAFSDRGAGVIEVRSVIRLKRYRITADEYAKFREFALFIARKEGERIVLVRERQGGGTQ